MILGVDHLALSGSDLAGATLQAHGYRLKFAEPALPNHPAKRAFLSQVADRHGIAWWQRPGSAAIEVTCHPAPLVPAPSPYQVLLAGSPPAGLPEPPFDPGPWQTLWAAAYGMASGPCAYWPEFAAPVWYDGLGAVGGVRALLVPVRDLAAGRRFWCDGLGWREAGTGLDPHGRAWCRLSLRTPVPAWSMDVLLAEAPECRLPGKLDVAGFPCLALLSNRLETDIGRVLAACQAEASETFSVTVHGKVLDVKLLRGPNRELVELIQLPARPQLT